MNLLIRKSLAIATAVLLLAMANIAFATPIVAVPVSAVGASAGTEFGDVDSDGTINFYIPLETDGEVYGVDGGGMSADSCDFPGTCDGGSLTMFLYFEGMTGLGDLNILFTDLDETGFNDPWFFLETIVLYDGNGVAIPGYTLTGDDFQQELTVTADFSGSAYLELFFYSSFDADTASGRYTNTIEGLYATVTSVPEPGTLALLGIGLLTMGLARRRKKV